MTRTTKAIKLMTNIIEKLESGEYDFNGKHSKALSTYNHVRRHYGISRELADDITNGYLRAKN